MPFALAFPGRRGIGWCSTSERTPVIRQETSPPHTGIATFCEAAYVPDLEQLDADFGQG